MSRGAARVWTYGTCGIVATVATACSSQQTPVAGLEVRIETDLQSPLQYNAFRVEVSHQVGTTWKSLLNNVYEVPTEAALPTRLAIAPSTSGDQDSLIQVTALSGYSGANTGTSVVARIAQIQVPTTRVAELTLELSKTCIGVKCSASESCQPSGGATPGTCEPRIINPALLPTYESVDASDIDVVSGRADSGEGQDDAQGGKDSTTSIDGTTVDAPDGLNSSPDSSDSSLLDAGSGDSSATDTGLGDSSALDSGDSGSTASCSPTTQQCMDGLHVETCGSNGQWGDVWACETGTCSNGACMGSTTTATSCPSAGGLGLNNCGSGGSGTESCCTSLEVSGGLYYRMYTNTGSGPTGESDPETVSGFRLDKYLVTVGRFRQFVSAWNGGYATTPTSGPTSGSGKHTHLNGGHGLVNVGSAGGYESGWDATDWNNTMDVNPTTANLQCGYNTWTSPAGSNENLPINCVTWYESYAFCIWDGGFLPTEAEWEYAAAGGSQQREYPWGTTTPGTGNQYAIYEEYYTGNPTFIAPVGTASLGAGYWSQLDLVGDLSEWTLDWDASYVACTDCANTAPALPVRVVRGGSFDNDATALVPQYSNLGAVTADRYSVVGFRCARTP